MSARHEGRDWESHQRRRPFHQTYFRDLSAASPPTAIQLHYRIVSIFLEAFAEQRTVYVFGNGGSAASASHMMCDINKGVERACRGQAAQGHGAH